MRADVSLNVYLYYGAERNRSVSFLASQDVVLTTYNVLSSDFGVSGCGSSSRTVVNSHRIKLKALDKW